MRNYETLHELLFRKICAHGRGIIALDAYKDKYLNYKTSTSGDPMENVCVHFHDNERLNFFGISNKFNITDGGCPRVTFPEMIALKENANIKLIVGDKGKIIAFVSGNKLLVGKSNYHLSGVRVQQKVKRRQAY